MEKYYSTNTDMSKSNMLLSHIVSIVEGELVLPDNYCLSEQLSTTVSVEKHIKILLNQEVHNVAQLDQAGRQTVSFLSDQKYRESLANTKASAVIVTRKDVENCHVPAIVVTNAYVAFAKVSQLFTYKPIHSLQAIADSARIHPTTNISEKAIISDNVVIGAYCDIADGVYIAANTVIEDYVILGENSRISANVTIGHHTKIGKDVNIHAQASIGAEGFGFAPNMIDNVFEWEKISQLGKVVIADKVRIGANTCIDRGTLGDTVIGKGVIIDNLVQVAHNVHIGDYTAIAACCGIAGSTHIGKHCVLAGGVGVTGHIHIVDNVTVTGMSIVTGSIKKSGSYSSGTATMPTKAWRRSAVNFQKLATSPITYLMQEIKDLKNRLYRLESKHDS